VPISGPVGFQGMATDLVATAASQDPVLSTLVTAVKTANQGVDLASLPLPQPRRTKHGLAPRIACRLAPAVG
jgi:hypothetical protein